MGFRSLTPPMISRACVIKHINSSVVGSDPLVPVTKDAAEICPVDSRSPQGTSEVPQDNDGYHSNKDTAFLGYSVH
ncbi:hypothetical protein AVEN_119537-1 [Araneus ventricosus]|uniref:Uncharacterized protein n=1 Tax=Araneus ventricosus TaxID=182803 RepID=A0A4Y2JDN0_ARAVE|nr:hypothetical protein AVEN_119537-1 [Araneus ventricosus]